MSTHNSSDELKICENNWLRRPKVVEVIQFWFFLNFRRMFFFMSMWLVEGMHPSPDVSLSVQ